MPVSPDYVTVYAFSPYLVAGWPLVFWLVLPVSLFWHFSQSPKLRDRLIAGVVCAGLFLSLAGVLLKSFNRHLETMSRVRSGDLMTLEGVVSEAHCIGKGRQAFRVESVSFEPSDYDFQPGFESAKTFSDSVVNGMRVRIHYFDATWGVRIITKLENDRRTGITTPGAKLFGPCDN